LFEIFTRGHVPYIGMHNREVIEQVQVRFTAFIRENIEYATLFLLMHNVSPIHNKQLFQRGYRMSRPQNCPPPIYDEMLKCWNADALAR
jgi:hypothetical protein